MGGWRLERAFVERLYGEAAGARWDLPIEAFEAALERSARHAFADPPDARTLARYAQGLRLADLALATACALGCEAAWEHVVREYRPLLYRAAGGIDPSGGARDLADALYAELFGLTERDGERRSHFRYFHGRSSLATWLRAVLAQRHVDRVREARRFEPLPATGEPDPPAPRAGRAAAVDAEAPGAANPDRPRHEAAMGRALTAAVAALPPRDRLRLRCYYAQQLTLAQIGRALGEHEATVSRQLARARRTVRAAVERDLREREGMGEAELADCFTSLAADPGGLDVAELLGAEAGRKESAAHRSEQGAGAPAPATRLGKIGKEGAP